MLCQVFFSCFSDFHFGKKQEEIKNVTVVTISRGEYLPKRTPVPGIGGISPHIGESFTRFVMFLGPENECKLHQGRYREQ